MNKYCVFNRISSSGFVIISCFLILCFSGCQSEKDSTAREEARKLYKEMCRVTASYTDSILSAKDSLTIFSLFERYEEEIERVNYASLPDTDYSMSEDQNDTIFQLLTRLTEARSNRLEELANLKTAVPDSIVALDSLNLNEQE